jgi:hypothetical protein
LEHGTTTGPDVQKALQQVLAKIGERERAPSDQAPNP